MDIDEVELVGALVSMRRATEEVKKELEKLNKIIDKMLLDIDDLVYVGE